MVDCHIHMVLDGVNWKDAIARHKAAPQEALIRQRRFRTGHAAPNTIRPDLPFRFPGGKTGRGGLHARTGFTPVTETGRKGIGIKHLKKAELQISINCT